LLHFATTMSDSLNMESLASALLATTQREMATLCDSSDSDEVEQQQKINSARAVKLALELHALGLGGAGAQSGAGGEMDSDEDEDLSALAPPKRSQNTTEIITVPSSEHVAEIVGKQGCKIKLLRQKTNTYIKTPGRGDNPQFVITGRWSDVQTATTEIREAAQHFTQLRAERSRIGALQSPLAPSEGEPGTVTVKVRVPYKVVGLVVGPKGTTIKRIQQTTHTYIVTPSREKDPVFEVTGLPENVEVAKQEIEAHIATRTGSGLIDRDLDFAANGTDVLENGEPAEPDSSLDKNHSTRAMEALHKLAALSPSERANCEAALQSLNNNSAHRTNTRSSHVKSHQRQMNHVKSGAIQFPENALSLQVQLFNTQSSTGSPFTPLPVADAVVQPEFDLKYPVSTASPVPSSVSSTHPTSPPVMGDLKSRHMPPNAPTSSYSPLMVNHHHHHHHHHDMDHGENGEMAQIVVDLKKLGVDLDKDVGRSIQKGVEETPECPDVTKSKLNPTAASWTPGGSSGTAITKKGAIGQKPIGKPLLAPNFRPEAAAPGSRVNYGAETGRKTPPNVQKIQAGNGIYIQTKHKQTTLRSSRDQQNFPALSGEVAPEKVPNINPLVAQTIFQRNQGSVPAAASTNDDDLQSLGTIESGYNSVETSTTFSGEHHSSFGISMCSVCNVQPQQAALVPCGHSGFCYMCALTISAMQDARCPMCRVPVKMALKIR